MAKALKWLMVVILVMSGVALVLGIKLFTNREVLKGGNQKLQAAHLAVAKQLHYEKLTLEQLKANEKGDLPGIEDSLKKLTSHAEITYLDLCDTKKTLAETKDKLAKVTGELGLTKEQLAAAITKINEITEVVAKKTQEIADKTGQIAQLEGDKTTLQSQVDDLNKKIAKNEADITELHAQVKERDINIRDLRAQLGEKFPIPKGTTGKILAISPEWNFCILDIGRDHDLCPSAEMLIHRGEQLVGRVRIGIVHKKIAIADILPDYTAEGVTIQEGDRVLY
ncbi:MAG: hypothetical protein EPN23_05205 [Verrucomicrobia bacterium]|nr:MAG: hypothetical protein EPN23_05205 [Verrucomicrobiota bacterium]